MFLHRSQRENQVARIYGRTSEAGISLISRNYRYPFLVEEEEHFHGALLSNTTHGVLLCVFGSFAPPLNNISALPVYNRLRYNRQKMRDDCDVVQETIAKYLAFLAQTFAIDEFPGDLLELFEQFAQQYPLLFSLTKLLGAPFANDIDQYFYKRWVVHTLGKVSLNTSELNRLYNAHSIPKLAETIEEGQFWETNSPDDRLKRVLRILVEESCTELQDAYTEYGNYEESHEDLQKPLAHPFVSFAHTYFSELLEQHECSTEAALTPIELARRSFVIAKRIERAFPGLFTQLDPSPFQLTSSSTNLLEAELADDYAYSGDIFGYDPAFKIYYEPRIDADNRWAEFASVDDLEKRIAQFGGASSVLIVPGLEDGRGLELRIALQPKSTLVLSEVTTSQSLTYCYLLRECIRADVERMLSLFPKEVTTILLPYSSLIEEIALAEACADQLGKFGTVVFWNIMGVLSEKIPGVTKFYFTSEAFIERGRLEQRGAPWGLIGPTPLGMINLHEKLPAYGVISCVPGYFYKAGYRFSKNVVSLDSPEARQLLGDILIDHPKIPGEVWSVRHKDAVNAETKRMLNISVTVYRRLFVVGVFPEQIPLYDPVRLYEAFSL